MNYVNQAQIPKESLVKKKFRSSSHRPISRIDQILTQSCQELKDKIKHFQLESVRILIFGPSGSGKSSLIQTMSLALNGIKLDICIKDLLHNEGTKCFKKYILQQGTKTQITSLRQSINVNRCEISLLDTRGQIMLNKKEHKQLELLIEGKVKDQVIVQQRNYRYAQQLWEFWKQDVELFPQEILGEPQQPNQIIIVFDGSLDQVPNGPEEVQFYKEIIYLASLKGFYKIIIVLTSLDKLEKQYANQSLLIQKEKIDQRIESIVKQLNLPREQVFFLENYHGQPQNSQVDHQCLKLLYQCLVQQHNSVPQEQCQLF